jgi:hypothetical protein
MGDDSPATSGRVMSDESAAKETGPLPEAKAPGGSGIALDPETKKQPSPTFGKLPPPGEVPGPPSGAKWFHAAANLVSLTINSVATQQ